jgi:hypothetical protein
MKANLQIFPSVREAIRAGFMIDAEIPDAEGFLRAHAQTTDGWSNALVRPNGEF